MSNRRRSKQKIKIPLKFGDTVCYLMGNKNNDENGDISDENKEMGENAYEEFCEINEVKGTERTEESEVMEIVNEFPTIAKSLCRDETVSDKKYGNTTTKIPMEINESDIIDSANSQNSNNNKPVDNKLDNDGFKMKTYATTVSDNMVDNKLKLIPTGINDGREVVMFDDEILQEGIKKWQLTLCGHFVGYRMSYVELRYNLGRMWGKYGLIDIITHNDMFLFKFRDEEGMDHVLESGPWMVNNKPLFIQRWNTNVIMDKKEPKTLPLWVKLYSVPIEAWTVNGISSIASSLGKPLIMDKTTTRMCNEGRGRVGYARVLVEVQADKEFKEKN
ncbi:zinc knuckle CX2CX4HX4C containing protein [Tanacetum coccineum]